MATKKEQTNFLTSSDLKAALLSKNIDAKALIKVLQA